MGAPYNPNRGQTIRNDANGMCDRDFIAHLHIEGADAETSAPDSIKTAVNLGLVPTTINAATLDGQPRCARVLSITGNAATAVGNVVISGRDSTSCYLTGPNITETIVSTGAATVIGTKAFAFIDSIQFPAKSAVGDTISVGLANRIGIPYKKPHCPVMKILNNGTVTTVASSHSSITNLCENIIEPTEAMNGSDIDVYLMV